jgi:peptide/nickel transport system substrate-binding protein
VRKILFGLLMSLLIGLTACSGGDEFKAKNPIVYGLTLQPSGFDPHVHSSSELGIVLRQVYDTLVYRHPETREFVAGLATSWTISNDGLTYTFTLRQDVTFHDGTPFNAQAVAANLDRIMSPDTGSQRAQFMLGSYVGHDVVSEYVVQIRLDDRFAPLLDSLSQVYLGMASPTAFNQYSVGRYQFHQVGTGPYEFVKFTPSDELILRRNEAYNWGPEFYQTDVENPIDEIVYRFFTDPPTRTAALESGDVHIVGEILPSFALTLAGSGGQLLPTEIPGIPTNFMMNTAIEPTNNLFVRQALIQATNRPLIVDTVFRGYSPVAWGPLSRATLYYSSSSVNGRYPFNVDQARALLEAGGYTDSDGDGLLDRDGEPLTIIVIVPPWGLIPDVAQLMQAQWRELGITAQLEQVSGFAALRERVSEGNYHLVAFDTPGYDPYVMNSYYMSDGANNYMNYNNPELDAALLSAVRETSTNTRQAYYSRIQEFIMDEALILPIRDYVNLNATRSGIEGLQYDAYGWFPMMYNVSYTGQ